VERGSDKHSPRLDEALDSEVAALRRGSPVEARAQPEREKEGPADGEPTPDALLSAVDRPGTAPGHDEIEGRAELARQLKPSVFPARPLELAEALREDNGSEPLVSALANLPDRVYENVAQVWAEMTGHDVESRD
jgi:hypothetical protein